jgi:hypothetical protein
MPDYVRAELRSLAVTSPASVVKIKTRPQQDDDGDEEDDDESDGDGDLAVQTIIMKPNAVPRNVFGRAEDEITHDFALPVENRPRPRASEPPGDPPAAGTVQPWQPLSDDEATGEALLSSLKRAENAPEGEPGPGGPGLN